MRNITFRRQNLVIVLKRAVIYITFSNHISKSGMVLPRV